MVMSAFLCGPATESAYESVTDTAKKIRVALKAAFPHVKFSVRSDSYSMGSSVNVKWTDGPTEGQVEKIACQHESIDRDQATGEILSGGNRFVHCNRSLSDRVKKYGEMRAASIGGWHDKYEQERHGWDVSRRTEVRPDGQLLEWAKFGGSHGQPR